MTRLRVVTVVASIILSSAGAYAQALDTDASQCFPLNTKGQVIVTKTDGSSVRDTLLCMGQSEVRLVSSGAMPLDSVLRIDKPRDGVFDGVLKGASVGLAVLILCGGECGWEPILRMTAAYAIIGGSIDALQGNNPTIYRRGVSPSLALKIRF
jgi:hypothetical protein